MPAADIPVVIESFAANANYAPSVRAPWTV
jgi:hypothetical protein